MKTVLIFFLSVISTQITFSQSVEGYVKDKGSGLGISYAVITSFDRTKGVYSDTTGYFNVDVGKEKTIIVSSVGYASDTLDVTTLGGELNIFLVPTTYEIEQFTVARKLKKSKKIKIGDGRDSQFGVSTGKGTTLTRYIENVDNLTGYLESVEFKFIKNFSANCSGIVRVRVFEAIIENDTIKPGRDLLEKSSTISVGPKRSKIVVPAAEWKIELPAAGLFVGLEFMGDNPDCPDYDPENFGRSIAFTRKGPSSLSWERSFDGKWSVFNGLGGTDWNLSVQVVCKVFKN